MRDLKHKIEQEMLFAPQTVVSGTFTTASTGLSACNAVNVAAIFADQGGTAGLEVSDDLVTWTPVTTDLQVIGQTLSNGAYDAVSGVVTDASYVGNAGHIRLSGTVDASTEVVVYAVKGDLARG